MRSLLKQRRKLAAEVHGLAAGAYRPGPDASYAAGLAFALEGNLDDAVTALSQVLLQEPGNAEAHNNLGLVLQRLGRLDEAAASFRRAIFVLPSYVIALTNLGALLTNQERHEEAIEFYKAALRHDPVDVSALNNLGAAQYVLGQYDEAIRNFEAAIALAPEFVDAHINLGAALREVGREEEAIGQYKQGLALRPDDAVVHLNLAHLLHNLNRYDDAIVHFNRSCELAPSSAQGYAGLARVLQEIGKIEEARRCLRQAIAVDSRNFNHYMSLANISKLEPNDPVLIAMLSYASEIDGFAENDKISAHFALGKILADIDRNDEAFTHILAGNALRRRHIEYDERRTLDGMKTIRNVFKPAYINKWPAVQDSSELPIFIVGMPRSGSTLVEQILASHPQVICAGETNSLRETLKQYKTRTPEWKYLDPSFLPADSQLRDISKEYLKKISAAAGLSEGECAPRRITDKMLGNFHYLALIHKIFPKARIVHTFRDPIETCMSSFSINFADQPFAFDLRELGKYYQNYAALMRHWRQVLPTGTVFDVRYEAVVQNFHDSARAIVSHCGLDWTDECLRFYEADRPVRTASVEQVRRPIYQSSIRRWRPDSNTLRPLLDGLKLQTAREA